MSAKPERAVGNIDIEGSALPRTLGLVESEAGVRLGRRLYDEGRSFKVSRRKVGELTFYTISSRVVHSDDRANEITSVWCLGEGDERLTWVESTIMFQSPEGSFLRLVPISRDVLSRAISTVKNYRRLLARGN